MLSPDGFERKPSPGAWRSPVWTKSLCDHSAERLLGKGIVWMAYCNNLQLKPVEMKNGEKLTSPYHNVSISNREKMLYISLVWDFLAEWKVLFRWAHHYQEKNLSGRPFEGNERCRESLYRLYSLVRVTLSGIRTTQYFEFAKEGILGNKVQ